MKADDEGRELKQKLWDTCPVRLLRRIELKSNSLSAPEMKCSLDLLGDTHRHRAVRAVRLRPAEFPYWPRRMNAELAAAYCGEASVRAFLSRVGATKEFPLPRIREGRRVLWLRDDLDKAMEPRGAEPRDIAEDL